MGWSFSRTHPPASDAQRAILNFPLASSFRIKNLPSLGAVSIGWGSRSLPAFGEVERFIAAATWSANIFTPQDMVGSTAANKAIGDLSMRPSLSDPQRELPG